MPWFKADDRLPDHRKIRQLGRDRLASMGLWLLSGCWSSGALTDGFVPAEVAGRYGDDRATRQAAEGLIRVGLWVPETVQDEQGYQFHDWGEWQPTRESIEADREAAKQRQRRSRQRGRGNESSSGAPHGDVARDSARDEPRDVARNGHVTPTNGHATRHADVPDPVPARPGPSRPEVPSGTSEGGTRGRAPARAASGSAGPPPLPSEIETTQAATAALAAEERPGEHWPEQPCGRRHDPDQPCGRCGRARRAEQDHAAEVSQAEAAELAERRAKAEACGCRRTNGWVEDDEGRPIVRCDHERSREQQLAEALDHAS